jgi:anti-sigma B factor antagonist
METSRPVVVKRMPDRLNFRQARIFLREVQPFLVSDRPQVVFDFSQVRQLDAAGVDMLLHCLSEVMKRDGDLKLASLSPHAATILELTRTDRLFEIYETSSDAVGSFTYFLPNAMRAASSLAARPLSPAPPSDVPYPEQGGNVAA